MGKPTPGPWQVRGQVSGQDAWCETRHVYSHADRKAGGTGCVALAQSSPADARLIAAAPELLEALKKLRLESQHYKQTAGKGVQFLDGAINVALDVIARAEGRD